MEDFLCLFYNFSELRYKGDALLRKAYFSQKLH